jgi:hypothetical protein
MTKTVLAIAFAVASIPMFAAQTPANPPAAGTAPKVEAPKTKKHSKKAAKKAAPKKDSTSTTGAAAAKPVSK